MTTKKNKLETDIPLTVNKLQRWNSRKFNFIFEIADDSDLEGTSPSTSKLNTSTGSSGGKKERHFWQYNVQAKGPKGQKINFETRIDDPHVLNEIVDPVFSGDVQLQGIKHRYVFFIQLPKRKKKLIRT